MKRGIWIGSALGILLLAVMAAPVAEAACSTAQQFSTGTYPNYFYSSVPAGHSTTLGNGGAARIGHFWEPGKRLTQGSTAAYDANTGNWWQSFDNGASIYGWYLKGNLTDAGVNGCPGVNPAFDPAADASGPDELIIVLEDKATNESTASFYAARVPFNGSAGRQFDMGPASAQTWTAPALVEIPKPFITTSGRSGAVVTLDLTLADVASGFQGRNISNMALSAHSTVTAYQLCSQERLATAPAPTRNRTDGWVCADVGTTMPGGRTVTGRQETCANTTSGATSTRRYLATGLSYDNGQQLSTYVSRAVVIPCDPTVATPGEIEQRRPDRPGTDIRRPGTKAR